MSYNKNTKAIYGYAYYRRNRKWILAWGKKHTQKLRKENPLSVIVSSKKKVCKKKNIPFNLDKKWAVENYTGKCSLTGIPFVLVKGKSNIYGPSIDRINPKKGYIKANCRVVLAGVNFLKFTGTDKDMYKIAKALVKGLTKHKKHGITYNT